MKWKRFMPYWIYFVTMLVIQVLIRFVAPFLLLLLLTVFPVLAFGLAVAVGIVGNALQHNLGRNSRMERIAVAAVGSLLIVAQIMLMFNMKGLFCLKRLSLEGFQDTSFWIIFGIHFLIMYVSMEATYLLCRDDFREEIVEPTMSASNNAKREKRYAFPIVCSGILIFLIAMLAIGFRYQMNYAKSTVAESFSPDREYQVVIYQVGSPDFPFGATHCRAILERNEKEIREYDFSVSNDGGNVSAHNFDIRWNTDHAEIISSGEEQGEQLIIIYFEGTVATEWLAAD